MPEVPSPVFVEPVFRSFNPVKSTWCSGLIFEADPGVCAGGGRRLVGSMWTWGFRDCGREKITLKVHVSPC